MRFISAAIVVLSGAIILSSGAHVQHGDTASVVMLIGGGVGLIGLISWWKMLKNIDS